VHLIRRKVVVTTTYILCALCLRLAFAAFEATGTLYDRTRENAPSAIALMRCPLCNATCSSEATVTNTFLMFTPELFITNNLISVPLALLVALW